MDTPAVAASASASFALGGLAWIGLSGQACFAARVLLQWLDSERHGESRVDARYWWLSLAGSALVCSYGWTTGDPIFFLAPTLNGLFYARNLALMSHSSGPLDSPVPSGSGSLSRDATPMRKHSPDWLPIATIAALLAVLALWWLQDFEGSAGLPGGVLAIGGGGALLWMSRYAVQWWIAERQGASVLPAAFFWMSGFGGLALGFYAFYRGDLVFVLAYALTPITAARNLVLIRRTRSASAGAPLLAGHGAPPA